MLTTKRCCEFAECLSEDVKVESEAELIENSTSTSISISNAQSVTEVTEAVIEITDQVTSSSGLDGVGDDRVSKGESVTSTKKHSISVEARF